MPRSISLLVALALTVLGAASAAAIARAAGLAAPAAQDEATFDLYMSDVPDGPARRNFPDGTSRVFAVLEHERAAGETFAIQLRDLSGILVRSQSVPPRNGSGKVSYPIAITDFVGTYTRTVSALLLDTESDDAIGPMIGTVVRNCSSRPAPSNPWPPELPTPTPGQPTPTPPGPDPYELWLRATAGPLDGSIQVLAELTRTLQAALSLPDVEPGGAGAEVETHLVAAQAPLVMAANKLGRVGALLRPPDRTTQPDPALGCQLVDEAAAHIAEATTHAAAGLAAIPADVSAWSLVATASRFDDGRFVTCLQYFTELFAVVAGVPDDTAARSTLWTVGTPGAPALIFPGPDQTDAASLGTLRRDLPDGASAVYAKSVELPGLNHTARVGAYVTDGACRPVDGATIDFSMDPEGYGTLSATTAQVVDGSAETVFEAGDDVPVETRVIKGITVRGQVGSGASAATAETLFSIIGPSKLFRIIVNPRTINRLHNQRGGITVEIKDANGRSVADGTRVTLAIAEGNPGQLAYEVRRRAGGTPELVIAGRTIDLVTIGGRTVVPASQDPGVQNLQAVYLVPGDDGEGAVTLTATADGNGGDSDDPETGEPTIFIVSQTAIYLPMGLKNAAPQPSPADTPRPTRERP